MEEKQFNSFGEILADMEANDPLRNSAWYKDFTGQSEQERSFEHQEKMLEKEQQFELDYKAKMQAMIDAGISPAAAAQGLSGAAPSSPTAPGVPSATGSAAAGLSSIGQIAQLPSQIAQGITSARETSELLEYRKKQLIADSFLKFTEAGYTKEMARGLAIANAFLPTEKFLGIVSLTQNIENLRGEYEVMMQGIEESKARISEIDKHIEEMGSAISLNDKLALESEKRALYLQAQTTELNWYNQKRQELGIDPKSPIENNLFMLGIKGDANYQTGLQIVTDAHYASSIGDYSAQDEYAFSIASKEAMAKSIETWRSRPDSLYGSINQLVAQLREKIKDGKTSLADANKELLNNHNFAAAYQKFKDELHNDLILKRKAYHSAKRTLGTDAAVEAWQQYQNALHAYENCDEESFSDMLLNQY